MLGHALPLGITTLLETEQAGLAVSGAVLGVEVSVQMDSRLIWKWNRYRGV